MNTSIRWKTRNRFEQLRRGSRSKFRKQTERVWRALPCVDYRFGRLVDIGTGDELVVRHSRDRGQRFFTVLKRVRNGRVVEVLAVYDRRSLNGFRRACSKAYRKLARWVADAERRGDCQRRPVAHSVRSVGPRAGMVLCRQLCLPFGEDLFPTQVRKHGEWASVQKSSSPKRFASIRPPSAVQRRGRKTV